MSNERRFIISNSAVTQTRKKCHFRHQSKSDEEIRDFIDKLVSSVGLEGAEVWWEKDPDYGLQKNWIIDLQDKVREVPGTKSFAMVREAENGFIVVTIMSERHREEAVLTKWFKEPPTPKRTRGANDLVNKPFEKLKDIEVETKKPDRLVLYKKDGKNETILVGENYPENISEGISKLVSEGVPPNSISVWEKRGQPKITVKVDVEGL